MTYSVGPTVRCPKGLTFVLWPGTCLKRRTHFSLWNGRLSESVWCLSVFKVPERNIEKRTDKKSNAANPFVLRCYPIWQVGLGTYKTWRNICTPTCLISLGLVQYEVSASMPPMPHDKASRDIPPSPYRQSGHESHELLSHSILKMLGTSPGANDATRVIWHHYDSHQMATRPRPMSCERSTKVHHGNPGGW